MNKTTIGIIQTTRIGDVLQTSMAAKDLKSTHPDTRLILIARKSFASGLDFLTKEIFDHVYTLDLRAYFSSGESCLADALENIENLFFKELKQENFDVLINLSFSKGSAHLLRCLKSAHKLGLNLNAKNEIEITDRWSHYIYSSVQNGILNPFNLVDIYSSIIGTTCVPIGQESDSALTTDEQSSSGDENRYQKITIHPFASNNKKHWKSAKWVNLLYEILCENEKLEIKILGSLEDKSQACEIIQSPYLKKYRSQIEAKIGDKLENVAEEIKSSNLLICHDSMISHLAAFYATPTIVISLGVVRPHETSPYNLNSLNLVPKSECFPCSIDTRCSLTPCHLDISIQLVSGLASRVLNAMEIDDKFIEEMTLSQRLRNCSIYTPVFEQGFMRLIDIEDRPGSLNDTMRKYYRVIWGYFFKEVDFNEDIPFTSNQTNSSLHNLLAGIENLFELLSFGMKFSKSLMNETRALNHDMSLISEQLKKLNEIDELLMLTKKTYPELQPLIDYLYVAKANISGVDFHKVCENTLLLYYTVNSMTEALYSLIQKTLPKKAQGKADEKYL